MYTIYMCLYTYKLISDVLRERQQAFLGHLIRCDPSNLMRKPTIDDNLVRPQQLYKRVGQPRKKWVQDNARTSIYQNPDDRFARIKQNIVKTFQDFWPNLGPRRLPLGLGRGDVEFAGVSSL